MLSGLMLYAGCVDLTLPPNTLDGAGAGDARADLAPVFDAPVVSGDGGTGGTGGPGTGGSSDPGSDAATGFADTSLDDVGLPRGSGGTAGSRDLASNGGGGGGLPVPDAPQEPMDAPPGDGSSDTPIAPPLDGPPDAPVVAPTAGLVVYYTCELADGSNLQDLSGKGNSGQIIAMSPDGFRFDSGKIGKGLTLSQAGESGYVGFSSSVLKGATALTIATWIKVNTATAWQRIFEVGVNAKLDQNPPTGTAYLALILKDANDKFGLSSTKDGFASATEVTAAAFEPGAWHHVAFVMAGGGATLYLDGVAVGTNAAILPPKGIGTVDYAYIGKSQFSADPLLDAEIDEFRVYNRALAADEIRATFEYAGP
jgi:hypothetical protein